MNKFLLGCFLAIAAGGCAEVELTGEDDATGGASSDAGADSNSDSSAQGGAGAGGAGGGAATAGAGGSAGSAGAGGQAGQDSGAAPTCTDKLKNGSESDVDCGGSCPTCANGKTCNDGGDCTSAYCNATCQPPPAACSDKVKNGSETDVDCGGSCPKCAIGKKCVGNPDCQSGNCVGTTCQAAPPSCTDKIKNGSETDVDCGGSCPKCQSGKACSGNTDCTSGQCAGTSCAWVVIVAPNGNNTFSPKSLTIATGDTVRWVWEEKGHTVTGGSGCGDYSPGWCSMNNSNCQSAPTSDEFATYDRTFPTAGTFPYYCRPHCGNMKATVTVQ